jgi:predicted HAD superfamily hydrolase
MFSLIDRNDNTDTYLGNPAVHTLCESPSRLMVFRQPEFVDSMVALVRDAVSSGEVKLLSMDVFDTILIRNGKCELRRFMEMGAEFTKLVKRESSISLSAADFFLARLMATKISYRLSKPVAGCREGFLDEIHQGICEILGIPTSLKELTIKAELEYETEALQENPLIQPILLEAMDYGVPVALISDMYMGRAHISVLIDRIMPGVFQSTSIYSSGDLKISKRAGLLFDYVAEQYAVAPSQCLHIGDNLNSDYLMAKSRGWKAAYLPLTDNEVSLIEEDERQFKEELRASGIDIDQHE